MKSYSIFFLVFLLLMLGPVNTEAQPHPGSGSFQLPEKAKADIYFAQGKFKEALQIYKSVLEDETEPGYIFRNMVRAWDATGAIDQADIFLNGYRQSHEKSSSVWYALGYLQYIKGEDLKASELFQRATELDPLNGLAWNNWAASLVNGKHFQEALRNVRTDIRSKPKELMFYFNLNKISGFSNIFTSYSTSIYITTIVIVIHDKYMFKYTLQFIHYSLFWLHSFTL
jgi:tetratricopeptide (TPR) repeat protein